MLTSTITSKGQVTLPAKLRKELGLKPSDRVFFDGKNGEVVIKKLPSIDSLFGSLANPKIKPLTTAQIRESIEKRMFSKYDRT